MRAFDEQTVFRSLFSAYPDALLVADANGTIVLANPSAAALLGYAVDELIGLGVDALVPNSIRPQHAAYREAYAKNPKPRPMGMQMDLVAKRKDGSEVMVEIALSPLRESGAPLVVAAIRDIGAYPRVKQALQRARYSEHLAQLGRLAVDARDPKLLLEQVPLIAAAALEVEAATIFLLESNRLEFRVAADVGSMASEGVGALVANRPDTPVGFVLSQGRPVVIADLRAEDRFTVPQSYLDAGIVSGLLVPLSDRGRVIGVLGARSREPKRFGDDEVRFVESLANLLATSLQRAQSEEALNHAQRLESVGQLTGGIAHDFNNLLTVIQGNLQVLEESPALAGQAHALQLVAAAARASKRGAELTGKLLAFSRRQVLQPSAVDVDALLRSLSDMLRRTLDQHIRIELDVRPCPPCLADAGQLESALLNIAINARDAMPEGGTLRFHAQPRTTLPDDVHGELDEAKATDTEFVAISISDSGTGMAEEVKERVFEPFFTTKEAGRGTGLGLSTVYGFVKQSKGGVAIDSRVGHGTTVTLYIPQVTASALGHDPGHADEHIAPGLRVLLVEDDPDVRSVVQNFLDTLRCDVTSCSSGEHALRVLQSGAGLDLLLTDIALGAGMRGTTLAALAQEQQPALRVLLMSGFSAELLEADRDSPPSWELLRKPYSRAELARAIASVTNP
jgi:PAS domain S-box-containing protein